jgi:hypothetical protein
MRSGWIAAIVTTVVALSTVAAAGVLAASRRK